jgi:hypothetical protein
MLNWNGTILFWGGTEVGELFTERWSPRFGLYKHTLPSQVRRIVGDAIYKSYRKFIVVRHPIERVISAFQYIRTLVDDIALWFVEEEYLKIGRIEDFSEFITSEYFNSSFTLDPMNTHDIQRCFLPQSIYFDSDEYQMERFDWFKFEDLVKSTAPLLEKGYLISRENLPHENKSRRYSVDISPKELETLVGLYKNDFDLFGYDAASLTG